MGWFGPRGNCGCCGEDVCRCVEGDITLIVGITGTALMRLYFSSSGDCYPDGEYENFANGSYSFRLKKTCVDGVLNYEVTESPDGFYESSPGVWTIDFDPIVYWILDSSGTRVGAPRYSDSYFLSVDVSDPVFLVVTTQATGTFVANPNWFNVGESRIFACGTPQSQDLYLYRGSLQSWTDPACTEQDMLVGQIYIEFLP